MFFAPENRWVCPKNGIDAQSVTIGFRVHHVRANAQVILPFFATFPVRCLSPPVRILDATGDDSRTIPTLIIDFPDVSVGVKVVLVVGSMWAYPKIGYPEKMG